ncbi:RNA polymerase sigma factor [Antrihabitans cavernicola]|uniref:Sigma-70 family RNA polymerase sigma factor n=1 Tax=Antrihabitans cavernicola TaxID=2495913 RepID=A0A5A7S431_9NOCA|nr:sigma-70 family RNA polymerase sigma factor [Spelaeibacter cavernicola]KAA0020161.1 sigma-70 family RNA polymerase sigma factor [Spelaeibacter cavernicola]
MPDLASDDTLLTRLRARDERAFEAIVDSWSGGMARVARNFVSTHESAAEVVQDTWLAVIHGLDTFEGRSSLKTWVFRILINTAKRRGSNEYRTTPMSSLVDDEGVGPTVDPARFRSEGESYPHHWRELPLPWPSPEQRVLDGELRARVVDAVNRLPARQAAVITLRDIEGYDSGEVCDLLDISAANQRVLLHRARAFARGRIEEYVMAVAAGEGSVTA